MTDIARTDARRRQRAAQRGRQGDPRCRIEPDLDGTRPGWMDDGACRSESTDVFFAPFGERPEARVVRLDAASAVCDACAVQPECLEYAVRFRIEHGFWGGKTARERRRLIRQRRSA